MISRIHEKLGSAGFIVSIVALVAALGGTAFAMTGLNSKEKQEVKKLAKKFGKKGPQGVAGPQGSVGPQGPAGGNGKDGAPGSVGASGKSVVSGAASEGECGAGGYWFEVEGSGTKHAVCNGSAARDLASGETEIGVWGVSGTQAHVRGTLNFHPPVPLSLIDGEVYENHGTPTPECPGSSAEEPIAAPGKFCIYVANISGTTQNSPEFELFVHPEGDLAGLVFSFPTAPSSEANAFGSWAVTAQ
jgi:hypothetical protein